ncbi:inositol monophosphatase family protein [Desulfosediminicola flagellatus]|uniref:inositol monophosphatase family protein n=1 Tax=Desulfosediminicola flagellatus TaxID=2569541 RepID=UPI001E4C4DEC|nr:inositol monophosphatase family protein [Desulfosediminicola flagellatus]
MIDTFMKRIARAAGDICIQESLTFETDDVEYKGVTDLVTPVDRKVEDYLRDEITRHYPEHTIIGEERGTSQTGSDSCWIIDPIDGTTSYVHGLPGYTVSIALQQGGELVAGSVYAPVLNQMFFAEKGKGATVNGNPIAVSRRQTLIQSVLTTGFACIRDGQEKNNLEAFNRIMLRVRDIRRHGSAALDLAWVAAGKMDGYWERCLNIYDVAAGVLLVREAGGTVCDFSGGKEYPKNGIVATNGLVHLELMELLANE